MEYVFINKKNVASMDELYRRFSEGFHFPSYFGSNLDALYDCLTEGADKRIVVVSNKAYLEKTLGQDFSRVCRVLADAAKESPALKVYNISI